MAAVPPLIGSLTYHSNNMRRPHPIVVAKWGLRLMTAPAGSRPFDKGLSCSLEHKVEILLSIPSSHGGRPLFILRVSIASVTASDAAAADTLR